jgi:MFS family permease
MPSPREARRFARGEGFTETARGIFALMRETTAKEAAKTVGPDARRTASNERDENNLPVLQTHYAVVLMAKSRIARKLLSRYPAFRILMIGSSISMFGSRISTVAFPMLVLVLNNSPLIAGLVAFAAIAPSMLVYVPAGVLVDRWNPRRVMLISEALRGLAIASVVISLAIFGHRISIWFLILAMLAEEILEIFFTLADRRYMSRLMERDSMASRSAYIEVRSHAVVLAGRPVGPFLFEIQPLLPFVADMLSFLFSVASLVAIRRSDEPPPGPQRLPPPRQLMGDIGQGFGLLKKDRRAWLTVILMAVTSLVAQALILMFLAEAHSKALSTVAIGVVLAASGAGGAIGSIFSKFLPDGISGFWLPIQMLAWTVALAFLALSGGMSVSWSAVTMFTLGFTGAIGNINFRNYLVANVPDDMIARITGIGQMLAIGASAIGPLLGGAATQQYGVHGADWILFFIVVLLVIFSLFTPEVARRIARVSEWIQRAFLAAESSPRSAQQLASAPRRIEDSNPADLPGEQMESLGGRRQQHEDSGHEFLSANPIVAVE